MKAPMLAAGGGGGGGVCLMENYSCCARYWGGNSGTIVGTVELTCAESDSATHHSEKG